MTEEQAMEAALGCAIYNVCPVKGSACCSLHALCTELGNDGRDPLVRRLERKHDSLAGIKGAIDEVGKVLGPSVVEQYTCHPGEATALTV